MCGRFSSRPASTFCNTSIIYHLFKSLQFIASMFPIWLVNSLIFGVFSVRNSFHFTKLQIYLLNILHKHTKIGNIYIAKFTKKDETILNYTDISLNHYLDQDFALS